MSGWLLWGASLLLGAAALAQAAPPAAGEIIRNQATASYFNPRINAFETISSNTTQLTVAPVEALTLVPNLTRTALPGQTVVYPHVLTNTGNVAWTASLTSANTAGDDYDLVALRVVLDVNGNGLPDAGEPTITALSLAPGEQANILFVAQVPGVITLGQSAVATLTATTGAGATASVSDVAITQPGAELVLSKSVDRSTAAPGDTVRYTLDAFNPGSIAVSPLTVRIDGTTTQRVILRDVIPANTRFGAIVAEAGSQVLYHAAGAALHDYTTVPPAAAALDAVAFSYSTFNSNFRVSPSFTVVMGALAGGRIVNTAEGYESTPDGPRLTRSNEVLVQLPAAAASINYYRNGQFVDVIPVTRAGLPLFLEAQAAACNLDPTVAESYPLTIESILAADRETGFVFTETAPNSGIFEVSEIPTQAFPQSPTVLNDGNVQAAVNDTINATLVCGGQTLRTAILVDPSGVVFDSRTNQPLAGATVTLIRINADGTETVATVLDTNGQPISATVVTGADGFFRYPLVAPGNYRLRIEPPPGYAFPSTLPRPNLPPGRRIIDGSYGAPFSVSPVTGPVVLDVPLDAATAPLGGTLTGFTLEKRVNTTGARIGESLRYTVRVRNGSATPIANARVEDQLPIGFEYLAGSVRANNALTLEPVGAPGPRLSFPLGTLSVGQAVELTYLVRVGATSPDGMATNTARALSDQGGSNSGAASVQVDKGVFHDEAFVLGKIFVDCNLNRIQDPEELGIPGVRLYLNNGNFAISDAEGKYSFYGLKPRTHVLKVDPISLPTGSEMRTSGNRNAGDPHSLFIDLKRGELHRADFIEGSCAKPLLDEVKLRRKKGEIFASEISRRLDTQINTENLQLDPKTRPASGVLDQDGFISAYKPLLFDRPERKLSNSLASPPARLPTTVSLDTLLPKLEQGTAFGFMDLKDGDRLLSRDVTVRLVGREGAEFKLRINGVEAAKDRIGQKAVMPTRQLQAWEFVAVRLKPGENRLEAEAVDGFGNVRGKAAITLIAPGELGRIQLILPPDGAVADGQTPARVIVRISDDAGNRLGVRTPVSLETTLGRIEAEDLNPREPGLQTFVEGGEAVFDITPPQTPGEARLRASSGVLKDEQPLAFLPHLRPLVVAGLIEGALNLSNLKPEQLAQASPQDGFEQDIKNINFSDGDLSGGVRGSLFLKGKVKGDNLLTVSYDSDKDTRDRLFRDIDPDTFYPVYGDSAVKGFDAQSTGKLYVRVDRGRSYLMYGDYNTGGGYLVDGGSTASAGIGGAASLERRLSNYTRSLTGVRGHYEAGRGNINVFASYDHRRNQVVEIRGQGTSGPYNLNTLDFVRNSEKIELVTRDRSQPSLVLQTVALTRFADYSVDDLDGSILFNRPVPSLDANLNPVFIRVSYEVDSGGESFWVYGADGQYKLTDKVEIGASYAHDDDPTGESSLYGANLVVRFGEDSYAVAETARSENADGTAGSAHRLEYVQRDEKVDARVFAGQTETGFNNPNSGQAGGRLEGGWKATYRLNDRVRLGTEGIYTDDQQASNALSARKGALATVEYALTSSVSLETGVRRVVGGQSAGLNTGPVAAIGETTSARLKATYKPGLFSGKGSVFGEYEQDVTNSDLQVAALGGDYQLGSRGRLYARHEFISSLNGIYDLSEVGREQNSTVVGIDYDYLQNASVFSEYRVRDALSAREAEAAVGLRNTWQVAPRLKLITSIERVQPMNATGRDSLAIALGAESLINPLTKAAGRVEWRTSDADRSFLNTLGLARKLSLDWTVLAKNSISWNKRNASGTRLIRDRFRIGVAYRDTDTNRWMWLTRYETRYDDDEDAGLRRQAHVLSTHVNYHPWRALTLSGRYAYKWVDEDFGTFTTQSNAQLVSTRVIYDITERVDLGLAASALGDASFGSVQYGVGAEAGYLVTSNVWFSGGYNFVGYSDEDLNDADYTRDGPFMRLRFKFDEDLFTWLE
ncbi:MAG: hypothetical protein V4650_07895 [Pseudomonadota bacterium]